MPIWVTNKVSRMRFLGWRSRFYDPQPLINKDVEFRAEDRIIVVPVEDIDLIYPRAQQSTWAALIPMVFCDHVYQLIRIVPLLVAWVASRDAPVYA